MGSKVAWILAALLAVGLGASLFFLKAESNKRAEAEKELLAQAARLVDAKSAAEKAVAARQESEAARQKSDADLALTRDQLEVTKRQAIEFKDQLPKLQADAAQSRQALAEIQRANPAAAQIIAKIERSKPAPAPKHNNGGWSVADVLPADTLGVVTLRDLPITIDKAKQTGLWRIISDPEFERVYKVRIAQIQGYVLMAEFATGEKLSEILPLFAQGEITLAMLGANKRGPDGRPLPDMLLSVQVRDKADAFMVELNRNLDRLKAATNGKLSISQTTIGNSKVTVLQHPDVPVSVSFGVFEGTFVLTMGEGRLEKLLAMREASKNPGAAKMDVLSQVPAYKRALEKAGPDADILMYVNVQGIAANPILNARELTPTQKHELEMSGLTDVEAVSYSAGITGTGVREALFLDVPANKRKGVLGLIDGESADLKAFYAAPRNSVIAGTFKISPDKLLDKVVELAAIDNPKVREDMAGLFFIIGEQLKIDVKKDLIEVLTGQGVFSLSVPAKNQKLALAFPQPILTLQVRNKEGLQSLLKALAVAAVDKIQVSEVKEGDKVIEIIRQRVPDEGKDPAQLCYAIDGSDLLVSIFPLALRDELKRRTTDSAKLEQDPDFNLARANLASQPQAMMYVDTAAIMTALYDIAVPIAQIKERNAPVDINALPSGDLLNQNLGSALYGLQFAADGVYLEGYSPAGVATLMLPLAAIAPRMAQGNGPNFGRGNPPMARAAVRDFGVPRVEAQKADTLGKVYRDLKEYAAEHGGNFPAKLDEMKPKYLQDIGDELQYVVYRGKQAADNLVLAHSDEKLPGPITLLLQNGSIQTLQRQLLGKVLTDGYSKNLPPPGTQSVKPPKPPDF